MSFTLDRVIPWGRSFAEYRRMFALSEADLKLCEPLECRKRPNIGMKMT